MGLQFPLRKESRLKIPILVILYDVTALKGLWSYMKCILNVINGMNNQNYDKFWT